MAQSFYWQRLCDPVTGVPVVVRFAYLDDGTIVAKKGFYSDGTVYAGNLKALINCVDTIDVEVGDISIVSSALPLGASTANLQSAGNVSLSSIAATLALIRARTDNIDVALSTRTKPLDQQHVIIDSGSISIGSVSITGVVDVDGSGVTQPISAASLPLPAGAATLAAQTAGNSSLSSIDGKITAVNTGAVVISSSALPSGASTEATLAALNAKVTAIDTGAVTIAASALPLGGATSALQTAGNSSLSSIDSKITAVDTGAVVVASSALPSGAASETTLSALNAKVTAVNTGAVVVSSSALPSGASTEATLSALNAKVTAVNTGAVVVSSSALPSGAASETTLAALNTKVTAVDTGAVTVAASALPSGASTETTLAALNTKVTAVDTGAVTVAASALPSGAASEATLASLVQAQGGISSTQSGPLIQAAVTAANPVYTPGYSQPLTQNTFGELRVDDSFQRRLDEKRYITELTAMMATIIGTESENSERRGFELR